MNKVMSERKRRLCLSLAWWVGRGCLEALSNHSLTKQSKAWRGSSLWWVHAAQTVLDRVLSPDITSCLSEMPTLGVTRPFPWFGFETFITRAYELHSGDFRRAEGLVLFLSISGSPVNTEPPCLTHRGNRRLCLLMPEKWNCFLPRDYSISLMAEPRDSLRISLGAGHSSRVNWQQNPWQSVPDSQQLWIVWHTCRTMLNSQCLEGDATHVRPGHMDNGFGARWSWVGFLPLQRPSMTIGRYGDFRNSFM